MERDSVYVGQLRAVPIRPGMFLHDLAASPATVRFRSQSAQWRLLEDGIKLSHELSALTIPRRLHSH